MSVEDLVVNLVLTKTLSAIIVRSRVIWKRTAIHENTREKGCYFAPCLCMFLLPCSLLFSNFAFVGGFLILGLGCVGHLLMWQIGSFEKELLCTRTREKKGYCFAPYVCMVILPCSLLLSNFAFVGGIFILGLRCVVRHFGCRFLIAYQTLLFRNIVFYHHIEQ